MFPFKHAAHYWTPPFRYESEGTMIVDANGARILDVRGWGHLTGQGSHGIHPKNAEDVQDDIGRGVAELLNANWPKA